MISAPLRSRLVPWLASASAVLAAALCLAAGWLPLSQAGALAARTGPVLIFVAAMTIVTELADAAGVFAAATWRLASWVSKPVGPARRGRVLALWLLVAALATSSSIFLSLDTTAVLITPMVVLLARRCGLKPTLFALTTVWLANTASLLLPVSNLTNLLAQNRLQITPGSFAALLWAPAALGVIVPLAILAARYRKMLSRRFLLEPISAPADPLLLVAAAGVLVLLIPALVSGVPVVYPAVAAAVAMLLIFLVRQRAALRYSMLPAQALLFAAGLFVVVQTLQQHGLPELLRLASAPGDGFLALLSVSAVGAISSNLVNNLPAYLALEPIADSPLRLASLLIGSNLGPVLTPWASLATLLWHSRLRSAGVHVRWRAYVLAGVPLALMLIPLATLALWLTAGRP